MIEFKIGDWVSVRVTSGTVSYAGKSGEVVWVTRAPDGSVCACHVRLDGNIDDARVVFRPHELEPEVRVTHC